MSLDETMGWMYVRDETTCETDMKQRMKQMVKHPVKHVEER
jgi:hypothetical protein